MVGKTVLITGSRDVHPEFYPDIAEMFRGTLKANDIVIEGGANGIDKLVWNWCRSHDIAVHEVPAEWEMYGKAAGPLRNQRMLDLYPEIDLCIAFPQRHSRGTLDMVERAWKKGIEVRIYPLVKGATWTTN